MYATGWELPLIHTSPSSISDKHLRRIVSVSGVVASMAFVAGGAWLQMAGLEGIDADGDAILEVASEQRTSLLACYVLWNAAITVQFVFLVALSLLIFRGGHLFLALLGGLSGVVLTGLMFVGFIFLGSLAFRAPNLSPEMSLLLSDLFYLVLSLAGFPAAIGLAALSWPLLTKRGLVSLVGWFGMASALVHIEAAVALARSGAWSPGGWGGYAGPALLVAWMVGISFLCSRSDLVRSRV